MPRAFQKMMGEERHIVLVGDGGTIDLVFIEEEDRACVYRPRADDQWDALYFDHEGELLGQKVSPFNERGLMQLREVVMSGDLIVSSAYVGWLVDMARRGLN